MGDGSWAPGVGGVGVAVCCAPRVAHVLHAALDYLTTVPVISSCPRLLCMTDC